MTPREPPLPRKVWIGTYEYTVSRVPAEDVNLEGDYGACYSDDDRKAIFLQDNLDARKLLEIVFHEVDHGINWAYDIEDGADEETIATKSGLAWSAFFLDNPRFQRWLTYTLNRIRKERTDGA